MTAQIATAMQKHDQHVTSELGTFMNQAKQAFEVLTEMNNANRNSQPVPAMPEPAAASASASSSSVPMVLGPALSHNTTPAAKALPKARAAAASLAVMASGGGGDEGGGDGEDSSDDSEEEGEEPPVRSGGGGGDGGGGGGGGGGGPSGPPAGVGPARESSGSPAPATRPKEREKVTLKVNLPIGSPLLARTWKNMIYSSVAAQSGRSERSARWLNIAFDSTDAPNYEELVS